MQYDIQIENCDSDISYSLEVTASVRQWQDGAGKRFWECDVTHVELTSAIVWLNKCGMEVKLDLEHLDSWQRELERRYRDEIEAAVIEQYERREQRGAA